MTNLIDITDANLSDIFSVDPLTIEDVVEALEDAGLAADVDWGTDRMGAVRSGIVLIGVERGRWFIPRRVGHKLVNPCADNPAVVKVKAALVDLTD